MCKMSRSLLDICVYVSLYLNRFALLIYFVLISVLNFCLWFCVKLLKLTRCYSWNWAVCYIRFRFDPKHGSVQRIGQTAETTSFRRSKTQKAGKATAQLFFLVIDTDLEPHHRMLCELCLHEAGRELNTWCFSIDFPP